MNIVHVLDNFFPDSLGGTENYVLSISKEMQRLGHRVCIVSSKKACSEQYEYEGINVYRFEISGKASYKELTQKKAPMGLNIFLNIIKQISPDIVHFHTFNRAINRHHLYAVKSLGINTIFTAHQSGIFCLKGTMLDIKGKTCDANVWMRPCLQCYLNQSYSLLKANMIAKVVKAAEFLGLTSYLPFPAFTYLHANRKKELRAISEYSDCNIAISNWVYKTYLLNGVHHVRLVKQGVNPMFSSDNMSQSPKIKSERLRLLFVGRIYPIKGLDILCDALEYVDKQKIEVTLACVYDENEYSRRIKNYITTLPYFNWYENLPAERVRMLMQENDLLILPSQSEMSPLVVLEALSNSLPVLGSDIAPITDIIADGCNGLLFKVNDSHSLSEQLIKIMQQSSILNDLRQNSNNIRTLDDVARDLIQIYSEITKIK